MAAAKGNKNAVGNTGGKSLNDRKLAAEVRSLALGEIKEILEQEKMTELKKAVILKLAPSLLPRLNEHTGDDGKELFPVPILSNFKDVSAHNSNNQNSQPSEENQGSTGRDISE